MKLSTECPAELYSGYFGQDSSGYTPECNCEITIDVDPDSVESDGNGGFRPVFVSVVNGIINCLVVCFRSVLH